MRRLIGILALAGALLVAVGVPAAAAQSYGPGLGPNTWYGPFAAPGSGPYGGIGATGIGATGFGCGQGAYGFSNYGYGVGLGIGSPLQPTCGGFGNWPNLYPFYTGYPYASGTSPLGAIALGSMANTNAFLGGGCDALALGSAFAGQPTNVLAPGASGQFAIGNNINLLNFANPGLSAFNQFGTFGTQNFAGCISLR
jgi:hypothetical protein